MAKPAEGPRAQALEIIDDMIDSLSYVDSETDPVSVATTSLGQLQEIRAHLRTVVGPGESVADAVPRQPLPDEDLPARWRVEIPHRWPMEPATVTVSLYERSVPFWFPRWVVRETTETGNQGWAKDWVHFTRKRALARAEQLVATNQLAADAYKKETP